MIPGLDSKKIAVLCGGFSDERVVSLRSGKKVLGALLTLGYDARILDPAYESVLSQTYDIAFNALHGTFGEDGAIQSLLEHYGIPYTGSGPQTSMLAMDKNLTKMIMTKENLPTAPYQVITRESHSTSLDVPFPAIIKPVNSGSSVGVVYCETESDYQRHITGLLSQFGCCMLEAYLPGKEITVGVIDRETGPVALPVLELIPRNKFYDYEAKYTANMTTFILPAHLDAEMTARCQELSLTLHTLLGCRGMSRTDMIIHPEQGPFILEINTTPGMTDLSDLPAQAACAGIPFEALVEIILESALRK